MKDWWREKREREGRRERNRIKEREEERKKKIKRKRKEEKEREREDEVRKMKDLGTTASLSHILNCRGISYFLFTFSPTIPSSIDVSHQEHILINRNH